MSAPDFSVAGQHVLISGGAGGIGTAFARAFRDGGAMVTICDIRPPATDEGFPFEPLDVRDDSAVAALAAKIDTLHVLIHCAGRLIRHEEHKPEVFRDIVDIHLVGNMRLATAFRPHLARTKGCLINIGSMYSYFGAAMIPAYAAAKTGIVGLTRSLALAYAEDGIRVNAIAPGAIPGGGFVADNLGALVAQIPIGRPGTPDDIAQVAVAVLSERFGRYVVGTTVEVDGGIGLISWIPAKA
jgi:NAD(P)-dependent dehydrogenase (short-subunit alcohol dehydrogenase family)